MKKNYFLVIVVLALAVGAGFFLFSPTVSSEEAAVGAPANMDQVGSPWHLRCDPAKEGEENAKQHCEIFQRINMQETGQRVVELAIAKGKDEKPAQGVFILPLGILLKPGILMQVDEEKPFKFSARSCTAGGCIALIDLEKPVLDVFRKGEKILLRFKAQNGQEVNLTMSLKGFAKAFEKLN